MKPLLRIALALLVVLFADRARAQDTPAAPLPTLPPPAPAPSPPPAAPPPAGAPAPPLVFERNEFPDAMPPPPPPPAPVVPPRPRRFHLSAAVEGAYATQSLYGTPINGGALAGYVGVASRVLTLAGTIEAVDGKTDAGLGAFSLRLGFLAELHVDRLRFGAGLQLGEIDIRRTTTDGGMDGTTFGPFARVSVDVFYFGAEDRHAVYMVAKGSIDGMPELEAFHSGFFGPLYQATIGVGVRF